ncbi:MAG TPA: DUF3106 domain-containing protein [Bryobacteraceae bacterium]|nr:DUF3106 domain-containing protein [Bryobacteraceae bacterium]
MLRRAALSLMILSVPALAGDQKNPHANANAGGGARVQNAPKSGPRPPQPARGNPRPQPSEQLEKLLKMNPADREKYLQGIPEKRRENLQKRLDDFANMPPARQTRVLNRLEMLNSLPAEKQQEVRQAMKQLQQLPGDRRALIGKELQLMALMPDDERRAHMNSEEFRNRYSATEQQMMESLSQVTPRPQR